MTQNSITRTQSIDWQEEEYRGLSCRYKDLSGEHIGARLEEIPPGQTSSFKHYHSAEEEHVFVLSGQGTLMLDTEAIPLAEGDHVCFKAAEPVAHHIINSSDTALTYLVFGERKSEDVVFYPDNGVLLVKAGGRKLYNYAEQNAAQADDD